MKEKKQFEPSIKIYHIIIFSFIFSVFLFNKINKTPQNNELQNIEINSEIINIRELYSRILSLQQSSEKVCNKSDTNLQEYYQTGDKSLIGLSDEKQNVTVSTYIQALLDIIGSVGDMKTNLITYGKHVIPAAAFLVIAILCIPFWFICCFCCCCNCCCCCCCKKPGCRFPCFIIVLVFDAVLVVSCIYGLANSNKVFVGISNTGCSVLKFVEEITEGETNKNKTGRWVGLDEIQDFLNDLSKELDNIGNQTIIDLNNSIDYINNNKSAFEAKKNDTCEFVNNETDVGDLVGNTGNVTGYWLLIYQYYGECQSMDSKTFSYLLNKEYETVAQQSNNYLTQARDKFDIISKDSSINSVFSTANNTLNSIQSSIGSIGDNLADTISDYSDMIENYGKMGFKMAYSILAGIDAIIASLLIIYFICGTTCCLKCKCCRCINKCFIHIFWNVMYLLMIFTFIIGAFVTLIGLIGKDLFSVVNYLIGEDNLSKGKNALLLGSVTDYLSTCFIGNGSLASQLGLGTDGATGTIDTLKNLSTQIDNVAIEFRANLNSSYAINYFQEYIDKTKNYDGTLAMLVFKDDPSSRAAYPFNASLEIVNRKAMTHSHSNWSIDCGTDTSSCIDLNSNKICDDADSHPDECAEFGEAVDWIVYSVKKINGTDGIEGKLNTLQNLYKNFLEAEVGSLGVFNNTIKKITNLLNKVLGDDDENDGGGGDGVFSFLNCTFIGTDVQILLKYLGEALGNNIYTVGKFLLVAGCSMLFSISFTILEVIIINKAVDAKIKELENLIPEYPVDTEQGKVVQYKMI